MTGELKGKNWRIAGSEDYFAMLNRELRIEFTGDEPREYYKSLSTCGNQGKQVIEKIYDDLKQSAPVVRYFPTEKRNNLIGFIKGTKEVMGLTGVSGSKADDCVSFLNLHALETKLKSGLSQYISTMPQKLFAVRFRHRKLSGFWEAQRITGSNMRRGRISSIAFYSRLCSPAGTES